MILVLTQQFVHKLIQPLLHFCFPQRCYWCHAHVAQSEAVCQRCLPYLPHFEQGCFQCAEPLPTAVMPCGQCQQRPPHFYRVVAAFEYKQPINLWLKAFKFRAKLSAGQCLTSFLIPRITEAYANDAMPTHVFAVPLHRQRLRQRGFNQTVQICKQLCRQLPCAELKKIGIRHQSISPQSSQSKRSRKQISQHDFLLCQQDWPAHVAIVDDVLTTGATANALAKALLSAGVQRVDVWCIARTAKQ